MYTADQVSKVLSSAGVRVVNESQSEFLVFCPFHNNRRTPAGEINHESGLFYCFSCKHVATLEDFLVKATELEYFQALRLIHKHSDPSAIVDQVTALLDKEPELPEFDADIVSKMHEQALGSQRALDYFALRGINHASIESHKLGYSQNMDMITLPFLDPLGNKYLGMEGRSIEGKRFMSTGPKASTLFNLNNRIWTNDIFLTESIIDCIRMEQIGTSAVASMGTGRGKAQTSLLGRYFNKIYIVTDNDTKDNDFAGLVSATKLVDKLGDRGIIVMPPEHYKDIGDMPDEEIKKLVARTNNIIEGI